MTPIMTSMLSVSRTILACIWVVFFQECQQRIVRTGRDASAQSVRRRGTGGCRAGWPGQARGFAAVQHRVARHRLRRASPLFPANTCTSRLPPGPASYSNGSLTLRMPVPVSVLFSASIPFGESAPAKFSQLQVRMDFQRPRI